MTKTPKQSLEDWVKESEEAVRIKPRTPAPFLPKPAPVAATVIADPSKAMTRYITLREWAASQFSHPPHYNTLIKWVHDGRIQPQPKKIGRAWQVRPHAEYFCD